MNWRFELDISISFADCSLVGKIPIIRTTQFDIPFVEHQI
jgi:hypothetical protein